MRSERGVLSQQITRITKRIGVQFGLQLLDVQQAVTADGRSGYFDTVKVTVI